MKGTAEALGHEPMRRLMLRMTTPAIVALLVQALYNVVDTIFVGRGVGPLGIAGIGVAFPAFLVIIGLGQLIAIGSASIISRALGRKDIETAERTLGNAFFLVGVFGLVLALVGLFLSGPLMRLCGATADIFPHALAYISIVLCGGFTFNLSFTLSAIVRAEGDALRATVPILCSGVLNIALDPLFIFGFRMGTAGAAWATVIAQGVGGIYLVWRVLGGRGTVRLHLRNVRLRASIARETLAVGTSSFIRTVAASLSIVVMNRLLGFYGGDLSIAIYSVVNRLLSFARMPVFGVVDGSQPIFGYNYGARQYGRVESAIWHALAFGGIACALFWAIFLLFPAALLSMFSSDADLIARGIPALRWIVLAIPLFAVQAIIGGLYQALGRATQALAVSLLRDVALIIPCAFLLTHFFGVTGVWASACTSDILSALIMLPMLGHEVRRLRRKLGLLQRPSPAG
jgi:putative MATE family efflux protein